MDTDEKVKRLTDLLAKSTPGYWTAEAEADKYGFDNDKYWILMKDQPCAYGFDNFEDAQLVAGMKNTLPLLLAERAILRADKQTSGLVASVLFDLESWLSDPRLGQWPYMEGDGFSRDRNKHLIKVRVAIEALKEGTPNVPAD